MFTVTQWPSTTPLTDSDREAVYKHLGSFQGEKKRALFEWAKCNTTSGGQPHKDIQSWFKEIFGQKVNTEFVGKLLRDLIDNHLPLKFEIYDYSIEPLPGFGLPLDEEPEYDDMFPVMRLTSQDSNTWAARTLTTREVLMLAFVEEISNKPEWWRKVKDASITDKWKTEALSADWSHINRYGDFVESMADACIDELQRKAELYEKTGLIPVFDYSAAAIKSDSIMSPELATELQTAVRVLEDVPDNQKDWHPGSNKQVLDLVHPSLWPLIYGQSRILTNRTIGLSDCLDYCGVGETVPKIDEPVVEQPNPNYYFRAHEDKLPNLSHKFQWLPCNVTLDGSKAKIESYINNLHPVDHANFYPIIEKFIELSLPAWDLVYRWPSEYDRQRITCFDATYTCKAPELCKRWCTPNNCPRDTYGHLTYEAITGDIDVEQDGNESGGEDDDGFDDEEWDDDNVADPRIRWFIKTHPMNVSDRPPSQLKGPTADDVKTSGFFGGSSRIQVIVKLANIHLTPDKPTYDGGSWHLEGRLNEHICATALFYYDSDNITDCRLNFRTMANQEDLMSELSYEQSDFFSIKRTFAIDDESTLQRIGGVVTRLGRALFFPNVYQHQVSRFKLADPTRRGHRKILALFLVDPAVPVISTANVPPQQQEWWARAAGVNTILGHSVDIKPSHADTANVKGHTTRSRFPVEVADMVVDNVEFPISLKPAKELREELIAERKILVQDANNVLRQDEWYFCEH